MTCSLQFVLLQPVYHSRRTCEKPSKSLWTFEISTEQVSCFRMTTKLELKSLFMNVVMKKIHHVWREVEWVEAWQLHHRTLHFIHETAQIFSSSSVPTNETPSEILILFQPPQIYVYQNILFSDLQVINIRVVKHFCENLPRRCTLSGLNVRRLKRSVFQKYSLAGDDVEWEMKIYSNFHVEIEFNFT